MLCLQFQGALCYRQGPGRQASLLSSPAGGTGEQNLPSPKQSSVAYYCFFFFFFFRAIPATYRGSSLGVESELQLPAYTTATAMQDPSRVCDLHHSSQQRQILNPLGEARDWTCNLVVPSRIHFRCATRETPAYYSFFSQETADMEKHSEKPSRS